jgi:hypothetical protein
MLRVVRAIAAFGMALSLSWVPLASVSACSCAMTTLPDAIRQVDVAIVGVAEAMADGPPAEKPRRTRVTFSVERASRETGATIEVAAWAGSDAGCGIEFGIGERWVVLATRWEGALDTNLCHGNLRVDDLAAAQRADLRRLMPVVPEAAPEEQSSPLDIPAPVIGFLAATLLIGAAGFLAFRHGRVR